MFSFVEYDEDGGTMNYQFCPFNERNYLTAVPW